MNGGARKTEWTVWAGLLLIVAAVAAAFVWSKLGERQMSLPVLGQISDFKLTNQEGQTASLADLRGKVWAADVIFTRCPGPCARMTKHLSEIQSALPANQPVRLVTFTSDPDYDTPAVFKRYAAIFAADPKVWWFLTGDKQKLRGLEVNDFKFVVV